MNIITCNPYRILGILANATAREKERQVRKLKQYNEKNYESKAGKMKTADLKSRKSAIKGAVIIPGHPLNKTWSRNHAKNGASAAKP
jgi:hypothetical protein